MKKIVCYLLLTVFLLFPTGMASAKLSSGVFVDTRGHWAENEIEAAYNQGLMQGTGTNEFGFKMFSPETNVNRFQLAAVLDRSFALDYGDIRFIKKPKASDYFNDLEDEAWYSGSVVVGAINRIFSREGEFKGEEEVSRIEVARSIYNAFHAKGINVPRIMLMPLYNDCTELTQEDVNAMAFVSNTGIMKGNDNLFRPYDSIKRAELARVLNQCVKLIKMNSIGVTPAPAVKLECKEVKSESTLINIDLNIPVIKGMKNEQIQIKLNSFLANEANKRQDAMVKEVQQIEPRLTHELVSRFNQYYVTDDLLSFYVDYYSFTGGAHGMTDRVAYNFDLNTGEELSLSDLYDHSFNYTAMINEKVQAVINLNPEIYFDGEAGFKGISEDQRFYIENGNIIVYFLQYEIAPYAAGIRTFSVPFYINEQNQDNSDETKIIQLIDEFGSKLKNVSLLAPEDIVKNSINEYYGDLVSSALLAEWQNDIQNVPGRVASSPWPERIDITEIEKLSETRYEIKGEIISMTSVEMVSGGVAGKTPITLEAEKIEKRWLITSYKNNEATVYRNGEYRFSFSLPDSWQGYSLIMGQWEGTNPENGIKEENGPLLSIRHPQWTEENPRQDIPIMVFTHKQWNLLQDRELSVGAAPIPPSELGRNTKYVFALPARYNFAFPTGYEEVEIIIENNPLVTF